ncbi:MAG: putative maltokinase, partial [Syntrophobacteraceae bacterium]|nr:putative maltokinase [Syntrophobacteraceae bacterium]
ALADKTACTDLVMAISDGRRYPMTFSGELVAHALEDPAAMCRSCLNYGNLRHLGAEQSNTSVVIDEQLILKLFRQVEPGLNPDMEIAAYLTEKTDFSHIALVAGTMVYRSSEGVESTVALLQRFVPNDGDGWVFTQKALDRYFDEVRRIPMDAPPPEISQGSFWELAGRSLPDILLPLFGEYLADIRKLALRTAQFHLALSRERRNKQFTPEPLGGDYIEVLAEGFSQQCRRSMDLLHARLSDLSGETLSMANKVLEKSPPLLGVFQKLHDLKTAAMRIRCHGDYHLGQVLRTEGDFVLLDFEGEPLKTIRERREKQTPVKDLAGMMRSFSYAVYSWLLSQTREDEASFHRLKPWAEAWEQWVSSAFLDAYLQAARGAPFIPRQPEILEALLQAFLLDKALYELQYEINNRPNWLPIPLHGILSFLEAGGARRG